MLECDALGSGRVAFVLGPRSDKDKVSTISNRDAIMTGLWRAPQVRLGAGVDRIDRMCSLEYLQRYFRTMTRGARVKLDTLKTGTAASRASWSSGLLKTVRPLLDSDAAGDDKSITDPTFLDFCEKTRANGSVTPGSTSNEDALAAKFGLHVGDRHPFLRGKSLATGLADLNHSGSNGNHGSGDTRRFLVSRSLPDQLAITLLEKELEAIGLFDWRPDGIVLSKEGSGDASADEQFDAQLQQLFNVAVQGPATLTNLVGQKQLLTMPGDLVFVVVLCDRWTVNAQKDEWQQGLAKGAKAAQTKAFNDWRKEQFANGPGDLTAVQKIETAYNTGNAEAELGNFRVRMSTSSEMVHYSATVVPSTGAWKPGPGDRMGLGFGAQLAEYIVGGWCIGRVLDSAASRAQGPSGMSNSNPTTYSVTVDTHVEWWSGDRLYRKFCNVDGNKFKRRGQ